MSAKKSEEGKYALQQKGTAVCMNGEIKACNAAMKKRK